MVTSNNTSNGKVVKMSETNNIRAIPPRTLLGEVNQHLTCPLCRGYYIDATTIVECLHSFCRSCIIKHLQVKSYCPECEMLINSAKPNIKPDKALQDIVYKLVPGLFQKEMDRRREFYALRPGPAASTTPEQRGEDTERVIFSPEDVISFSLEYADMTDTDSVSSKSSDSNEQPASTVTTRRYLQCPAVVNISHLKKFIIMKFDIDGTQYSVDILYKRVPLPDYYTLMDIAYIYNWKRNEPMRFFYHINDFIAIRTRYGFLNMNTKDSHFHSQNNCQSGTEGSASSPALNLNENISEMSSGTDSPMPEENLRKVIGTTSKDKNNDSVNENDSSKQSEDEVTKSQFLNSFELTPKNSCSPQSPPVSESKEKEEKTSDLTDKDKELPTSSMTKTCVSVPKIDENTLKRKIPITQTGFLELKKNKSPHKESIPVPSHCVQKKSLHSLSVQPSKVKVDLQQDKSDSLKTNLDSNSGLVEIHNIVESSARQSSDKSQTSTSSPDNISKYLPGTPDLTLLKNKANKSSVTIDQKPGGANSGKPPTPLPNPTAICKTNSSLLNKVKKIPELKPSTSLLHAQQKSNINKIRMDLLANNCDPTMDRSKILSQVKSNLPSPQSSGDPLKSLFDSCKINIPSSLSITLTDQKAEQQNTELTDPRKSILNKNLHQVNTPVARKISNPPVHNYIEILKLPDAEAKSTKTEGMLQQKPASPAKKDQPVPKTRAETTTSAKGPIPSLKPISDAKLIKSGSFSGAITFQQSFEQQLQTVQSDAPKAPKTKLQVPKLMPATPKALSAASKLNSNVNKSPVPVTNIDNKIPRNDNVLDLSTSRSMHSPLGPQHTKTFEIMQTIANLAKNQNYQSKSINMPSSSSFSSMPNRPTTSSTSLGPKDKKL